MFAKGFGLNLEVFTFSAQVCSASAESSADA